MENIDLTIIFLTANKLTETWADYQREVLLKAADGLPIITISRKPLNWGINLLDTEPQGIQNIYKQMLRGAKMATTPYIAIAEDDTLYIKEHFHTFRPPLDAFAYNVNRLGIFSWGKPMYFFKRRNSNSTLIAPRLLLIEALEERFAKHPEGIQGAMNGELGRKNIDRALGVTERKCVEFETPDVSIVRIDHENGVDTLSQSHRKRMGIARSYDIPYWRRADKLIKKFL